MESRSARSRFPGRTRRAPAASRLLAPSLSADDVLDTFANVAVFTRVSLEIDQDGQRAGGLAEAFQRIGKVIEHRERLFPRLCPAIGSPFEPLDGRRQLSALDVHAAQLGGSLDARARRARRLAQVGDGLVEASF